MADEFSGSVEIQFPPESDPWIVYGEVLSALGRIGLSEILTVSASTEDHKRATRDRLAVVKADFEKHHLTPSFLTADLRPGTRDVGARIALVYGFFWGEHKKIRVSISGRERVPMESIIRELREDFDKSLLRLAPGATIEVDALELHSALDTSATEKRQRTGVAFLQKVFAETWVKVVTGVIAAMIIALLTAWGLIPKN